MLSNSESSTLAVASALALVSWGAAAGPAAQEAEPHNARTWLGHSEQLEQYINGGR